MLKAIKFLSIFILILGIGLFFVLSFGIKVEQFSFASINVSKLYIKLDKKLIVEIEKLTLPKESQTKSSRNDLERHIKYLPTALRFFQKVDIERLIVKNNEFTITLDNNIFYIDSKFINIAAQPFVENSKVTLSLYSMYLKDYDMLLDGQFVVDLKSDDFVYEGSGYVEGLDATLSAKSDEKFIYFDVSSQKPFKNLHFVKEFVRLNKHIEAWMYDNITGNLNLTHLKGKINKESFMPVLSSLDGSAFITDAQIRFKHDLLPVQTKRIDVLFKNDDLSFTLEKPMYKDTAIDGSNVVIHSLSQKGSNIVINIHTKSRLNDDILGILKAYNIKLPIKQLNGSTQSKLAIQIYFNDVNNILTHGEFTAKQSRFKLQNFEFFAHEAKVELKNSEVFIQDSHVEAKDLARGILNLNISTRASKAKGSFLIKDLHINHSNMTLLKLQDTATSVDVDFIKDTFIKLDDLNTTIGVQKEGVKVSMASLDTLYPYSNLLQELSIKKGSLYLLIKDKEHMDLSAKLHELNLPLLKHQSTQKVENMRLDGKLKKAHLVLEASDETFKLNLEGNKLDIGLKNLDIINESKQESKAKNQKSALSKEFITTIKGNNSDIYLNKEQKLLGSEYTLVFNKDATTLNLAYKDATQLIYKQTNDDEITLKLLRGNDEFINTLLGKQGLLNKGSVDVHAEGSRTKLKGEVRLKDTRIKNLAMLNNLIIFVNTAPGFINPLLAIPSVFGMATKKGFNLNGYGVTEGGFDFSYDMSEEQFSFTKLYTKGNMADFLGKGQVDLKKHTVDADIDIVFMKDYAKIVGYIPVVNYLFLGEDERIATAVQIKGDLDDPKVNTNLSKEAANVPLDMVRRIFNIPQKTLELFTKPEKETLKP